MSKSVKSGDEDNKTGKTVGKGDDYKTVSGNKVAKDGSFVGKDASASMGVKDTGTLRSKETTAFVDGREISTPRIKGASRLNRRREAVVERGENVVRELGSRVAPAELEAVIGIVERAFEPVTAPDASGAVTGKDRLMDLLTGGRTYSLEERTELETSNLKRGFEQRSRLLEGALGADEVRKILGCKTRQTVHDRCKANTLLGVMDRGAWKFPLWQFDPNGPDGVVAGLPAVLKALGEYAPVSQLQKASFLTKPSPYFGGDSALQVLKRGRVDDVIAVARGVGVN